LIEGFNPFKLKVTTDQEALTICHLGQI
jgi:hypothetical protein